jgi:ABC-type amino acid transport substrate-binding protein
MKTLFLIKSAALLIAALLLGCAAAAAQTPQTPQTSRLELSSLDHLAAKASQTVDVNIDERLMRLAAKAFDEKDPDEREVKKVIAGVKGIYVKSFEFDNDGQFTAADVEAIRAQVRGPGWTRVVNVTSKKEGNVEVYLLMNGETVGGLTVLSTEDRELTIVNIVGPVDLEKLAKLEGQFGVPDLGIEKTKEKKNDEN